MIQNPLRIAALVTILAGLPLFSAELLRLDFTDPAHLETQASPLPAGTVLGPVTAAAGLSGVADFHGGVVRIPSFQGPQGPFSIEARFQLRGYGPEDSRFIADILNTATWDNGPSQGFAFRVGGSYLYPYAPREAYRTDAEWQAAQGDYSYIDRGRMSVCFADFVIARKDDDRSWKQALTDRCIELGAWTHLAAVWDGADMRIYLNGLDATDTWRIDGAGKPTNIDSVETAFVGSRYEGSYDPRHLDGLIDFVKVENKALTPAEIHARYKETFIPEKRDSLCMGVVVPKYPEAGQICKGKIKIEIKVLNHGACTDPAFIAGFLAGDSIAIELSKNPAFNPVAVKAVVGSMAFDLDAKDLSALAGYTGEIFWRVRLIPKAGAHAPLAKRAGAPAPDPEWSPARPMLLDLAGVTALAAPRRNSTLVRAETGMFFAGAEPRLFDLRGTRAPVRLVRVEGGWRLADMPAGPGLLWLCPGPE